MRLKFNVFNLSAAVLSGMMLATGCTTDEGTKPQDDPQLETRGLISGGAANGRCYSCGQPGHLAVR